MSDDACKPDLTNFGPGPDKRGPTDPVDASAPDMKAMVDQIKARTGASNDIHSGMKPAGNFQQPWER